MKKGAIFIKHRVRVHCTWDCFHFIRCCFVFLRRCFQWFCVWGCDV